MDLGTIKNKLNANTYENPEEFRRDVLLTGQNCLAYNPIGDPHREFGNRLLVSFFKLGLFLNYPWKIKLT